MIKLLIKHRMNLNPLYTRPMTSPLQIVVKNLLEINLNKQMKEKNLFIYNKFTFFGIFSNKQTNNYSEYFYSEKAYI